ncbi:MAG: UDP-N-acetylmuramoyl-L-alanyl-D-glutamate--2,6-diaminopimelate ligase [Burkholderiaceae bacterium]
MSQVAPALEHDVGAASRWLRGALAADAHLCADSRAVEPGDAFLAMPGEQVDRRAHIGQAVARGAAAVVYQAGDGFAPDAGVPALALVNLKRHAGRLSSNYYGNPSSQMQVVAITGTNGKTSCSHWIARGMASVGRKSAVVGTLGSGVLRRAQGEVQLEATGLTTPDPVRLQRQFADFLGQGVTTVAIEASSIGLEQHRLDGTDIEVAVFTNLSRDHLDYHGDMAAYAAAKRALFTWPGLEAAVVNGDDPAGDAMLAAAGQQALTIAYGFEPDRHGWRAARKLRVDSAHAARAGYELVVGGDYGVGRAALRVLGQFNVSNALATLGAWIALGCAFEDAVPLLAELTPVTGRMQQLELPGCPLVVVDYAHTPDALLKVLHALRPVASARSGRLWCVFGAGGDRDPGKRPLMGQVAERHADALVITSDNPRGETPFRIVSDIRSGLTVEPWLTELDRGRAIDRCLAEATMDDVVLIAGKGHENYQEIGGVRYPFSDLETARAVLEQRAKDA